MKTGSVDQQDTRRCGRLIIALSVISFLPSGFLIFLSFFTSFLFICTCSPAPCSVVVAPIALNDTTEKYPLGFHIAYLEDKNNTLSIDDVNSTILQEKFIRSRYEVPNFGYTDSSFWIKFDLIYSSRNNMERDWLLELNYPPLDQVTLYQSKQNGETSIRKSGDLLPFTQREIKNRNFVFRINTKANQTTAIYLNIKTKGVMEIPLTLWSQESFAEKVNDEQYGLGFYYGLMIAMAVYNLLLYFSIKERAFLYYVLFIIGYVLFQTSIGGQGYEYIWPFSPWWANHAIPFFVAFCGFWMAQFSRTFIRIHLYSVWSDRILLFLMAGEILVMVLSLTAGYSLAVRAATSWSVLLAASIMLSAIICFKNGSRTARYFLIAWSTFICGMLAYALKSFGVLPATFLTEYAVQIGSVMVVILLSLAQGHWINTERQEKIVAQEKALTAQRESVANLKKADRIKSDFLAKTEKLVEQRTRVLKKTLKEVQEANKKITQSIQYASMIQTSMLPNFAEVRTYLPESFFIWMPRDIVGGDIFFFDSFKNGFVVAVMDCTGHGVPGALMTMIAFSALKTIIKDEGCHDPGEILKRLNVMVKTMLRQDTKYAHSDDGLDGAVCCLRPAENSVIFAGARTPFYYVNNDTAYIIKGDKQSIGYKKSDLDFKFTTHTIQINQGMSFYLTSDGFTTQRGGARGLGFGQHRFLQLLQQVNRQPFVDRRTTFIQAFNDYKGEHEALDDVTVVGFALNPVFLAASGPARNRPVDFTIEN